MVFDTRENMADFAHKIDQAAAPRVLIVTESARAVYQAQLEAAGYETLATSIVMAERAMSDFIPDVLLIDLAGTETIGNQRLSFARALHSKPGTYTLPVVGVCDAIGETFRKVAASVGFDDCFIRTTSFPEVLARLDSLFWRVAAGRQAPGLIGDQRIEIDNFLLLLDSVRDQISRQRQGSLGLIKPGCPSAEPLGSRAGKHRREAFGFFKLRLRRMDSVASYGPDSFIIYLPEMNALLANSTLLKLRDEFAQEHPGSDLRIGVASFPSDGTDVEKLLEVCETAVRNADLRVTAQADELETIEVKISEREEVGITNALAGLVPTVTSVESAEPGVEGRELEKSSAVEPVDDSVRARRVLLAVSDAPRMARLNSLIRSAGYEVRAAFDGEQTLSLLRIERPDLLILESELDKINGLEMINRLRKQSPGELRIPVLFLNSSGDDAAGREALTLGAREVLTQPYDPGDVLASIREALR
jgi:DNA-binding response OmpR family regulator